MSILVTGGTGFIGSHVVVELLKAGYDPIVIDNLHNSSRSIMENIAAISGQTVPFIKADTCDRYQLQEVFSQHKIDGVIHLAALKSVEESVREPLTYYKNNIGGLFQLMRVMMEYDCYKLIFSSSATVFGIPDTLPIKEDAPLRSTNPYGSSKIACEYLLKDAAQADPNWQIISLRYFNPAGAHDSGLLGEMVTTKEPANLFPAIMHAHSHHQLFKVFGDDYNTKDGTCIRDYLHIMDLAEAHAKALDKTHSKDMQGYVVVNLGSGQGFTVLEIIQQFEQTSGQSLPYKILPRRPGDVAANWTATDLAKQFLNWQTSRSLVNMWQDTLKFVANSTAQTKSTT